MAFESTSGGNGKALRQTTPAYNFPSNAILNPIVDVRADLHFCDAGIFILLYFCHERIRTPDQMKKETCMQVYITKVHRHNSHRFTPAPDYD